MHFTIISSFPSVLPCFQEIFSCAPCEKMISIDDLACRQYFRCHCYASSKKSKECRLHRFVYPSSARRNTRNRCRYKNRVENRAIYSEKEPIGKNVNTSPHGYISEGKNREREREDS